MRFPSSVQVNLLSSAVVLPLVAQGFFAHIARKLSFYIKGHQHPLPCFPECARWDLRSTSLLSSPSPLSFTNNYLSSNPKPTLLRRWSPLFLGLWISSRYLIAGRIRFDTLMLKNSVARQVFIILNIPVFREQIVLARRQRGCLQLYWVGVIPPFKSLSWIYWQRSWGYSQLY